MMEHVHGKIERGSVDGEMRTETTFKTPARHTSTIVRARLLCNGQGELSLDQYSEARGKRGTRKFTSIVLNADQVAALIAALTEAQSATN